jgi:putative endonuclease
MKPFESTNINAVIGKLGEDTASDYLIHNSYRIIHRNFHIGSFGEIDIIAEKRHFIKDIFGLTKMIVFIEVKAGNENKYYNPVFHVNRLKIDRLRRLAEMYLKINKLPGDHPIRIDVIVVKFNSGKADINHIENIIG